MKEKRPVRRGTEGQRVGEVVGGGSPDWWILPNSGASIVLFAVGFHFGGEEPNGDWMAVARPLLVRGFSLFFFSSCSSRPSFPFGSISFVLSFFSPPGFLF